MDVLVQSKTSTDVKNIKPFSSFRQNIKNSMIDGYNTVIDS